MYIIKNALRCISRAKGRNILIGIIVLVIAISSCIGLSIRQAAEDAKTTALENSMTPLNTLSTMAGWFLIVILLIGAVILIVLNIFNVRERKYEIGVLTAMGMKKGKVALQFLTEIFKGLADAGKCVILVSHSPQVASMCDKRYKLKKKSR